MTGFKHALASCAIACALGSFGGAAIAQEQTVQAEQAPQIDYAGFSELTREVATYREGRLLEREEFFARASKEGALILDTRSASAFEMGHIKGAVNLPFSDFTEGKLAQVIGDNADRPIFIYCNNNFTDNVAPVASKLAPLALNIPTFINLYGYGYKNVWELEGAMPTAEVAWVSPVFDQLAANTSARD
ncbi:rhodanese-like domain-containing protein [Qipengyuania sp. DGS5-3]|uniref:rhodanese-like domain-containing protein n=1 Tax=Qipengyuania sp. DGS5-3 TaxID=3349632 RepID=UPI0036D31588